jgi:hypothetical protein
MAQKKEFLLRVNLVVWRELQAWAADELRSVNGQIEFILRQAVETRRKKSHSEIKGKTN